MIASPLQAYYTHLDAGDAEGTAATFADDALYVRPSAAGGALETVQGREDLLEFFRKRGRQEYRHDVESCVCEGESCFVEGVAVVEGAPPTHLFLAHAMFDSAGLITRYFALFTEVPADWQRVGRPRA